MISNLNHVMTLANSIIGVGILSMPFCFQKCGIILSVLLLILSNYITRICCHYLIKSSLITRRKSFELLGFHAFGKSGKLLVELCTIGYLLGTCVTYYVVIGDLGPQVFMKMFKIEHLNRLDIFRPLFMIFVTSCCILPLGMLKNVDSLSTVCTASIGFYICLIVKIVLESEQNILAHDWQQDVNLWEPEGVLQCLPIFSMALSCQMQIFEVFGNVYNQSLDKLIGIVKNAIWICTLVYIAVGFFGYVAFCKQNFTGNILLNFSPSFGSDVISIGFILSLAFSFPLVIFPCRASIYSLLYRKEQTEITSNYYIPENRFKGITVMIVLFSLGTALLIPSVEVVIGLVGSTIGVGICVIFPALCFRKIVTKENHERKFAQVVVLSGFCLLVFGTYANFSALEEDPGTEPHIEILKGNLDEVKLPPAVYRNDRLEENLHPKLIKPKLKDIFKVKTEYKQKISTESSSHVSLKLKSFDEERNRKKHDQIQPAVKDLKETKLLLDELKMHLEQQNLNKTNTFAVEKLKEVVKKVEKMELTVNQQQQTRNESNLAIDDKKIVMHLKSSTPLPIAHAKSKVEPDQVVNMKTISQDIIQVADNQSDFQEKDDKLNTKSDSELDNFDAIRRDLLQLNADSTT